MDVTQMITDISKSVSTDRPHHINADGLMVCDNCGTAMQTVITVAGKSYTVNCLCRCAKAAADAEEQRFKDNQAAEEIKRNTAVGMRDISYRNMTFENADGDMTKENTYCTQFPKMQELNAGLMYMGAYGTGKTYRAACIGNQLLRNGYRVYMDNITSMCCDIQGQRERQAYINDICGYDLLILDDIGAERDTDYMHELVYNIIDTRYRSQKPLIITTNLSLDYMKNCDKPMLRRAYDRLFEMCCYPITLTETSRRRTIGNDKYKQLRRLLG